MFRRAVFADAEKIATLVNSAYRGDSSKAGWTTEADMLDGTRTDAAAIEDIIVSPNKFILTYWEEDTLLGCAELNVYKNSLYVGMVTVSPTLQNSGIGRKILAACEDEAKQLGCTRLFMTVISIRHELIAWYERRGFVNTGKKKPFAFSDPRFGQPKFPLEFVELEKKI